MRFSPLQLPYTLQVPLSGPCFHIEVLSVQDTPRHCCVCSSCSGLDQDTCPWHLLSVPKAAPLVPGPRIGTGAWRAPTFLLQPEVQIVQVWDGEGCRIGTCHLSSVLPEVKLFGRVGFCEMTVDIFPELK